MDKSDRPLSDMQTAVSLYWQAVQTPLLAEPLRERATALCAASAALRALAKGGREGLDRSIDGWTLQQTCPDLLAAHQRTWCDALSSSPKGSLAPDTRKTFIHLWKTILWHMSIMDVLEVAQFSDFGLIRWKRLFGKQKSRIAPAIIFCADAKRQAHIDLGRIFPGSDLVPIERVALLSDMVLRGSFDQRLKIAWDQEPMPRAEHGSREIYDYSYIGLNDQTVYFETIENVAHSIECAGELLRLVANDFSSEKRSRFDRVYRYLEEKKLSTAAFHRALNPIYRVTPPSIDKARARHRRAQQQGQAESQPVRTKKNTARRRKRARPAAKRRRSARREVTTP